MGKEFEKEYIHIYIYIYIYIYTHTGITSLTPETNTLLINYTQVLKRDVICMGFYPSVYTTIIHQIFIYINKEFYYLTLLFVLNVLFF